MNRSAFLMSALAMAMAMTACGGGGGGDNQTKQANVGEPSAAASAASAPSTPTPAASTPESAPSTASSPSGSSTSTSGTATPGGDTGWTFSSEPPVAVIDPDTQSFISALSGDNREVPRQATFAATIAQDGGDYVLDIQSGSASNTNYFSNITLPPTSIRLPRSDRVLLGFQTTQFMAWTGSSNNQFFASIQLLGNSGIGSVGIGHWKYLGIFQRGYLSGQQNVHGAFLVGQPTPPATVAAIPTGTYSGFSQGGLEANGGDTFDQSAAKTSVHYDAATHRMTIRLSEFRGWGGYFGFIVWDSSGVSPYAPADMICSGPVDPASGAFSCRFSRLFYGTIKGKFFGAQGQYIAGTYAIKGDVDHFILGEALIGGFIARRALSPELPDTAPRWSLSSNTLTFSEYAGIGGSADLRVSPATPSTTPVYAVAMDGAGHINPDVKISPIEGTGDFNIRVATYPYAQTGFRTGSLQLRLCHDDPVLCKQPVAGSPWPVSYQIETRPFPGPGVQPTNIVGSFEQGSTGWLSAAIQINQPSVIEVFPTNSTQYLYKITSSGILTPELPAGGFWSNQETGGSFTSGVLGFTVPADTNVGLYEGVVAVSVCGWSWLGQPSCLPVEQPTLNIPYKVEIRARAGG